MWMLSVLLIIHANLCFSQETVFRVAKIWDHANHNAFTDLIRHEGKFYCTFREADSHLIFLLNRMEESEFSLLRMDTTGYRLL